MKTSAAGVMTRDSGIFYCSQRSMDGISARDTTKSLPCRCKHRAAPRGVRCFRNNELPFNRIGRTSHCKLTSFTAAALPSPVSSEKSTANSATSPSISRNVTYSVNGSKAVVTIRTFQTWPENRLLKQVVLVHTPRLLPERPIRLAHVSTPPYKYFRTHRPRVP